jgi:hypothetical protein
MNADIQFTDRDELHEWLTGKPREWAEVIALRAALRVAPAAVNLTKDCSLAFFRTYLVCTTVGEGGGRGRIA